MTVSLPSIATPLSALQARGGKQPVAHVHTTTAPSSAMLEEAPSTSTVKHRALFANSATAPCTPQRAERRACARIEEEGRQVILHPQLERGPQLTPFEGQDKEAADHERRPREFECAKAVAVTATSTARDAGIANMYDTDVSNGEVYTIASALETLNTVASTALTARPFATSPDGSSGGSAKIPGTTGLPIAKMMGHNSTAVSSPHIERKPFVVSMSRPSTGSRALSKKTS
eukprot:CAMPEP_0179164414 /NCGR_PEP_ID=MMETSP0796-20121207/80682_1 /TAXON_ID=73915 /ORGANISM="Pyrodinium bahamense, Strain pbaha01" /LENGTH=230 /DNA_ID=CAMNT_0020866853 /DNA_START=21 /DNA_END=715 /DNA_ORIENTATION=+